MKTPKWMKKFLGHRGCDSGQVEVKKQNRTQNVDSMTIDGVPQETDELEELDFDKPVAQMEHIELLYYYTTVARELTKADMVSSYGVGLP